MSVSWRLFAALAFCGGCATEPPPATDPIFFADAAKPQAGYGLELMEWDWAHMEHERVAWEHTLGERTVTLSVLAERHATTLDEHVCRRPPLGQMLQKRTKIESLVVLRDSGQTDEFDAPRGKLLHSLGRVGQHPLIHAERDGMRFVESGDQARPAGEA